MCGNLCTWVHDSYHNCLCNGTTLYSYSYKWRIENEFCCTSTDDHCSFDGVNELGRIVNPHCSSGSPTNKTENCPNRNQRGTRRGRCYNSFQHSRYFGVDARYTCPDGRCVPMNNVRRELEDRCRGVEAGVCTNTIEECDDTLICSKYHEGGSTTPVYRGSPP